MDDSCPRLPVFLLCGSMVSLHSWRCYDPLGPTACLPEGSSFPHFPDMWSQEVRSAGVEWETPPLCKTSAMQSLLEMSATGFLISIAEVILSTASSCLRGLGPARVAAYEVFFSLPCGPLVLVLRIRKQTLKIVSSPVLEV